MELVKSLGASQVFDYTQGDLTQSSETYDVVFDAVGKVSPPQAKKALKPSGNYINVHAALDGGDNLENLLLLKELIEAGKLKPVIDWVYPLEQIVEAYRYVAQGQKKAMSLSWWLQHKSEGGGCGIIIDPCLRQL